MPKEFNLYKEQKILTESCTLIESNNNSKWFKYICTENKPMVFIGRDPMRTKTVINNIYIYI